MVIESRTDATYPCTANTSISSAPPATSRRDALCRSGGAAGGSSSTAGAPVRAAARAARRRAFFVPAGSACANADAPRTAPSALLELIELCQHLARARVRGIDRERFLELHARLRELAGLREIVRDELPRLDLE